MRRAEYMSKTCDPKTLTVRKIMEDAVFTRSPRTKGGSVAQLLTERNFGSVPVVEEDMTLVGLISEFDLLKAITDGKDLRTITAEDIMTPEAELVTVTEDMPIMDLAKIFQQPPDQGAGGGGEDACGDCGQAGYRLRLCEGRCPLLAVSRHEATETSVLCSAVPVCPIEPQCV